MNQNNKIFIAASLANGASFSMILPMLAPLVRKLRLTELQAGAMVSIGALLMAIAAIYISKHQQKYSIFQLLSIGFVGMAVTWGIFTGVLMYGLAAHLSLLVLFTLLMICRASTGVFMAMPQIALQTYVMTRYGNEQARAQSMSKFGALNSAGVVFGPLLTTLLLPQGMLAPLWAAILLLAGISAAIVFAFDREETAPQLKPLNCKNQQRANLQDGTQFSFKQCFSWLLWVGLVTMLLGLLISVSTQHLHIFQAAYVLYGISVACLIPAFTTGAAQTAPQAMQAKIASLCTATQALSFVAGPLISTGLYQWHSAYPYYFLIFNVVALMAYFAVKALFTNAQPQMAKE